ncbi:XdhC family protein [Mycolicibacterium sp. CBMA 226]|uniref:XdhC family protein n=1 Tax=Mycolicibacterium sp. CBMA 226 TaxID=2606611 RepID=UPI0014125615|nr:XdhC/CoxI family protein [Mycolicibacterium sp. CBMA 226]
MKNRAVLQWIARRYQRGAAVLAVTVTDTYDRSPYPIGSMMAFDRESAMAGSVSSGCVEADLFERAQRVFEDHPGLLGGIGCRMVEYESDSLSADPFAPRGPCGGTVRVAMYPVTPQHFPELPTLISTLRAGRPAVTFLNLQTGYTALVDSGASPVFCTRYDASPRMVIFGISDITVELAALATRMGYAVVVCDPRSAFLQHERFSGAIELVADRPDRYLRYEREAGRVDARTAIVDLIHDDRFSIPLLLEALDSRLWAAGTQPVFVGALGSSARSANKRRELLERGLPADDVGHLQAPIGLDLGGREGAHIALSILAQVVAMSENGSGLPKSDDAWRDSVGDEGLSRVLRTALSSGVVETRKQHLVRDQLHCGGKRDGHQRSDNAE